MLMLSLLLPLAGVSAEPACLLQKPKAPTQLSLLAEMPVAGWEYAGKGDCAAILQTFNEPDPTSCASQCSYLMLAFSFDSLRSSTCFCCQDLALSTSYRSFAYARAIRKWDFIGTGKRCQSPVASFSANTLNDCALSCEPTTNPGWFIYTPRNIPGCTCCSGLNPTTELIPIPRFSTPWSHFVYRREVKRVDVPGGKVWSVGVYGDPHITALDGSHYLLLSQGTFSLWHLHGLLTEFQTQDGFKKVPVEWEIFTHYSGHQSFTKGLLLIDRSAGVQRQVLEITSQDCQWRAHSGAEWTMVSKPGMISVAEGQDYVTGFNMTKTNGRKHRGGHASRNQLNLNQVHLSMNSKDGATDIAVLTVSCRPKRNLNLNLVMKRRSDHGFVEGELAGGKKLAALETDSEFNVKGKWQDVGDG
ncbi:unnamed protein product [Cladocopium goreaui]|uniref:Uncharacterized protein n=1 Tax=Cladocopium goreaui TaxID=2562237 RepID=A0A9P1D5E4_9DINO|nr:unnamed protein product [Cladocopium goreaui]